MLSRINQKSKLSKLIICNMSVRPSVPECIQSISIRLGSGRSQKMRNFLKLCIAPSDPGISLQFTGKSRKTVFRENSANLNFCILTSFMIVSGVKKVPDSEFLVFRTFVITGWPEFTEYLPVNSGRNFFLLHLCKFGINKVFYVADSEFCGFRLIRISFFRFRRKYRIYREIPV